FQPDTWVVHEAQGACAKQEFCRRHGLQYTLLPDAALHGFPSIPGGLPPTSPSHRKVLVTGCYDWFHSGHVRFFEEVSSYGQLFVVVGHDANIRLLKGESHPLLPQQERCYLVGSVRFVTRALVSSGRGWLDAEPEIAQIQPDIYVVNEDGDRGGKRE